MPKRKKELVGLARKTVFLSFLSLGVLTEVHDGWMGLHLFYVNIKMPTDVNTRACLWVQILSKCLYDIMAFNSKT